ncbi:MAG: hypothetical protein J6T10_03320 [Methanobrevibacter sp.]|nr:hypothetical protein [Methanobrevibacter sp.]
MFNDYWQLKENVDERYKELELQVNSYVGRDDEYDELKLEFEFVKGQKDIIDRWSSEIEWIKVGEIG